MQDIQITLPVGSIVRDRYKIERLLGKGGFGAVYLVSDQRVRGNVFALKELFDPHSSERQHFTFEGKVLSRVDHLSLPRVYRTFEDAKNARAYILMDYIEGQNLEVLRKKQPDKQYSIARVLRLMKPVFDAVGYLHQQHPPIVHRDIKPSNIIVPSAGEDPVLVDFGIAKEYVQDSTTAALRLCSPGYGAPEQYSNGTGTRTDIYGLAATMYVLLTGQLPADALHRMANIGSRREDSLVAPIKLVPTIPQHVSDAIVRAMSIPSDERYATVDDFWQALHAAPLEENDHRAKENAAMLTSLPAETQDAYGPKPGSKKPPETEEVLQGVDIGHQIRPRRRRGVLTAAIILLLFILGGGLFYGSSRFFPAARGSTPLHVGGTSTVAVSPTVTRPTPTSQPTATPSSTNTYPSLARSYNGVIVNQKTTPPTSSTMSLNNIQQQQGTIRGDFVVGHGLQGNGPLTGSVSSDKTIQFTIPGLFGRLPLFFQGGIRGDGSIAGTYCSYRGDRRCDRSAGGYGSWRVTRVGTF